MGFIHLCGVPSVSYKHILYKNKKAELWNAIKTAFKNDHILTTGTEEKGKAEELQSNGLLGGHCYTIVNAVEVKAKGFNYQLLQLRNPWGKQEWNGAWSDNSSMWTPALRKELNSVVENDGYFYISIDDFIRYFKFSNICKYNDDDVHSYTFRNKPVPQMNYFEFSIDAQQANKPLEIMVNQMGDRLSHRKRQDGTEFDPSWFSITLAQVEGQPKHIQKTKCVMPAYHIKSSVSSNY